MKRNFFIIIATLLCSVCLATGITLIPDWLDNSFEPPNKTFSSTSNLNDKITSDMDIQDIAKLYADSCVTIYVESLAGSTLGSGVCVAASGYQTKSGYTAKQGAYFVTNYHVVSRIVENNFQSYYSTPYIILNGQNQEDKIKCELVWHDKDVDMAILYCNENLVEINEDFGWVRAVDRSIACKEKDKLAYDSIFTLGTPLNFAFQNTLSIGYVSNQLPQESYTSTRLYRYTSNSTYYFSTNIKDVPSGQTVYYYNVLNNAYEDLIMMNLDMTNGNSGGAVFDEKGNIVGLATLGVSNEYANTASINFAVPIYPLTLVLDNVIEANENTNVTTDNIISFTDLGLFGLDAFEVSCLSSFGVISETTSQSYYYDERFIYTNQYKKTFDFTGEGFIALSTDENGVCKEIPSQFVITSIDKNDLNITPISNRNDLVYYLYGCKKGAIVNFNGYSLEYPEVTRTITVTL